MGIERLVNCLNESPVISYLDRSPTFRGTTGLVVGALSGYLISNLIPESYYVISKESAEDVVALVFGVFGGLFTAAITDVGYGLIRESMNPNLEVIFDD